VTLKLQCVIDIEEPRKCGLRRLCDDDNSCIWDWYRLRTRQVWLNLHWVSCEVFTDLSATACVTLLPATLPQARLYGKRYGKWETHRRLC